MLCITDVLAPDDVTLVLVVETVVLDVTEEVEELLLESAPLAVLAAVTAVDGVEVETVVVTVVDDSLGEAEVVEVLALQVGTLSLQHGNLLQHLRLELLPQVICPSL